MANFETNCEYRNYYHSAFLLEYGKHAGGFQMQRSLKEALLHYQKWIDAKWNTVCFVGIDGDNSYDAVIPHATGIRY